jgi:hypothetical protein
MAHQGASAADHQQPEVVIEPTLLRQAGVSHPEAATNPTHDQAVASAQPIPVLQDAPLLESPAKLAASAPRFELAAVFQAEESHRLAQRLDGYPLRAPGLPQIAAAALAASQAACVPKLSIAEHILPAAGVDFGFQRAISKMIASQDLGLLKMNQQLARSAAAMVAPHPDLFRNVGNFASASLAALAVPVNFTGISAITSLADLFLRWREAAESGMGVLRGLARAAFRAALRARAAVLHGDDGPVAWFIEAWLGLRVTPERIEAVSAALLEEGWDAGIPDDPAYLLTDLRRRTARQARVLRPIWETQLNHRAIGMLDQPVITGNGTLLTVIDLVPGGQTTEDLVLAGEWDKQRLRRALDRLKPDELQVTNVYAQRSELTWAEAARIAGAPDPAAAGERVRRKLKRLGAEDKRRLTLHSSWP